MELWDSLDKRLGQWFLPTKSDSEIQLNQQAREAKAGDELAKALEALSERDMNKVNSGLTLLTALKEGKTVDKPKEGENNE